jgi:hypothetical protein
MHEHRKGIGLIFPNRDMAADDNIRKSGDVVRGPGKSYIYLFNIFPTLKSDQPKIGSNIWKSIAHLAMSGAPSMTLENMEDRVPSMPSRTHNRIKSPR